MVLQRDPDVAVDACFCYGSLLCSLKSYQETHLRMSGRAAANREVYALLDYIRIYRNVLCGSDEKFPKDQLIQTLRKGELRHVILLFYDLLSSHATPNLTVLSAKEGA